MEDINSKIIALIGGGPAALLMMKNIINSPLKPAEIYIFEKNDRLGVGMPYGKFGSNGEHVANVSANELPEFSCTFEDYLSQYPTDLFPDFSIGGNFNKYQVIPRLLLGDYMEFQFNIYIKQAKKSGTKVHIYKNCPVQDIVPFNNNEQFKILTDGHKEITVDSVILCTGHHWPKKYEDTVSGWFDSPYPPSKFAAATNFPIAIRGSSLTAIDAVKTISRLNGKYEIKQDGQLKYTVNSDAQDFRIDLFSTGGFLPALRFHSEDAAYSDEWTMSLEEIYEHKEKYGFVDLNYVFDTNFKLPLKKKDPEFYASIQDLDLEGFVDKMMSIRKELDTFQLFKAEYTEAEKSIKRHQSVSWKEALSAFSYAMNYPAKHFSAEDMLRLRQTLLPLISIIIASLPQSSYKEIIALYDAGIIDLIQVDKASFVEPHSESGAVYHYESADKEKFQKHYQLFVDAIGQQPLEVSDLPFEGLKSNELISGAYLNFKSDVTAAGLIRNKDLPIVKGPSDNYFLNVHGLEINDHFQSLTKYGETVNNLFIMAVPFIGGLNPDYSGLDFCDTAAGRIVKVL